MVHLVMVGGGHAMLPSIVHAEAWTRQGFRVTLVDAHRYLYYSGMVPEYLGGVYTQNEVRIDLERLCRSRGISFVCAAVTHIDPARRVLTTSHGTRIDYDAAAFDIGSRNPGEAGPAIQTKPLFHIEDLAAYLDHLLGTPGATGALVIVGGGAAGVEIALNVSARFVGRGRAADLDLTIIERASRLLPGFPSGMSAAATRMLQERGVSVRCTTSVASVQDGAVHTKTGATLPAGRVLWATGTAGPSIFRNAVLPVDERGFLRVTPSLQCPSAPRLFAAGDCAAIEGREDLARIGVHAVKQGPTLRTNLGRMLTSLQDTGRPATVAELDDFSPYPLAPLILSSGTSEGFWTAGSAWLKATSILRLKHFVDRRWMRPYNSAWAHSTLPDWIDACSAKDTMRGVTR